MAILTGIGWAVAGLGWLPTWPGLIHIVALPPVGLAHDLAALLASGVGWPGLVLGAGVSLVGRSLLLAWMTGGTWRDGFLWSIRFYLAALPLAFLAAASFYATGALLFYALFWFGLIFTLVLLLVFAALPWLGSRRLRTALSLSARAGFRAGTVGAYLFGLTGIGLVADAAGEAGVLVMLPVSAALTWLAAAAMAQPSALRVMRRVLAAAAGLGLVALIVPVVTGAGDPPTAPPPDSSRSGSIMLMSGVDSLSGSGAILEIDPHVMGWTCDRTFYYSYAGPGDGQPRRLAECPIDHGAPYQRADTLRTTAELVAFLEAQTAEMVAPGVLAAHSQGVWLSWAAAAEDRLPNVETLVLVGPFPENPISYDPSTTSHAGTAILELITLIPRPGGTSVFEPASPLGREWLAHPTAIADTLARPLPADVRAVAVPSVFDLPLMPNGPEIEGAVGACPVPVIHPNLPYSPELQRVVVAFFEGEDLPPCPWWRTWVGPLFRHFSAPPNH